jgi:hypothetical protein
MRQALAISLMVSKSVFEFGAIFQGFPVSNNCS